LQTDILFMLLFWKYTNINLYNLYLKKETIRKLKRKKRNEK
jgi:hypothetical protein